MTKKVNLYLVMAVIPSGIFGVQESVSLLLGRDEYEAKHDFCVNLPKDFLRYLSKNPENLKISQVSNESLAHWCREVLGVRA